MLNFINSFQCTYTKDQNKVIIRFRQAVPNIDRETGEQDSSAPLVLNDITDLIMDSETALQLSVAISELCSVNESIQQSTDSVVPKPDQTEELSSH